MTDNGPCFYSHRFAHACRDLQLRHIRTRIYTPRTNGKAERFIQTAIREWAYARLYQNSAQRLCHLAPWIHQYNWHRPHTALNQKPPISRSGLDGNNLLTHHIYSRPSSDGSLAEELPNPDGSDASHRRVLDGTV